MKVFLTALAAMVLLAGSASADPKWNGAYLGINGGGAFGDASVHDTTGGVAPGPFNYSPSGFVGGGTAGLNWVVRPSILVGFEADVDYLDMNSHGIVPSSVPGHHQDLTVGTGVMGDVTARLGWLIMQNTMIYAKGGFAFYTGEAEQTTNNPGYVTHGTGTFTGWTLGGGVEHYFADDISLKLEYMHTDFGSEGGDQTSISDPPIGFVYRNTTDLTIDTVKGAILYHFN